MRAFFVIVLQVVMALLVAGAVAPAVLFTVPEAREFGAITIAIVVGLVFVLLRVIWPRRLS